MANKSFTNLVVGTVPKDVLMMIEALRDTVVKATHIHRCEVQSYQDVNVPHRTNITIKLQITPDLQGGSNG